VDAETEVVKEMAVAREMVGQRDSLDSIMAGRDNRLSPRVLVNVSPLTR
jgi:hypothetical protein